MATDTASIASQYHQFSSTFLATRKVVHTAAKVIRESIYGSAASVKRCNRKPLIPASAAIDTMAMPCTRIGQTHTGKPTDSAEPECQAYQPYTAIRK